MNFFEKIFVTGLFLLISHYLMASTTDGNNRFSYRIGYDQDLNSYQWLTNINYKRTFLGKGLLEIAENYNSSMMRLTGQDDKWKDYQKLNLRLTWPVSSLWGMQFSGTGHRFSDKLSGLVSDINTNWAMLGFVLNPLNQLHINTSAGYKYDDRLQKTDGGLTYQFNLRSDVVDIHEYKNQFTFLNEGDRYSDRKNSDMTLRYRVQKQFQEDTFDSLTVYWTKQRRDNYDRISIEDIYIASLQEENRGFHHFLSYGSKKSLLFTIKTSINDRRTSVSKLDKAELLDQRSKKEFHSENEAGIWYFHPKYEFNINLNYTSDNQKNEVPDSVKSSRFSKYFYYISPDFESSRLKLSTLGKYHFSHSDTLQLKSAVSIFRYDTPENNVDDRDEFRLDFHLLHIHYFSDQLKLILNASTNLYHLVYLFSERSANNNWMRIFRLFPKVIYKPNRRITVSQRAEVLANYVDYDYENGNSTSDIRSYVFRKFALTHNFKVSVTQTTSMFLTYKYEIEENGKLNWDRWTEVLITDRTNHWIRMNINFRLKKDFTVSPGLIYFSRSERKQSNFLISSTMSGQQGNLLSFGPTLKMSYQPHERINLTFDGMSRLVKRSNFKNREYSSFHVRLTWYR